MSKSTILTFELFQMFPDQESARLYLESRLWPDGVTCPTCRKGERITTRIGHYELNRKRLGVTETRNHWRLPSHKQKAFEPLRERIYVPSQFRQREVSHTRKARQLYRRITRKTFDL